MRFDLRLHGETGDGKKCWADISVYARSQGDLLQEAHRASENAAWQLDGATAVDVPEGSQITVLNVELLERGGQKER